MQALFCKEIASNQYQIIKLFAIQTPILPDEPVVTDFYILHKDGLLELKAGYSWNGGDWPAIDTRNMIYGSVVHDPFCQMLNKGELNWKWRVAVNQFFVKVLKDIGSVLIKRGPSYLVKIRLAILNQRCKWVYNGVDKLGPNPRKKYKPKKIIMIPGDKQNI